MSFRMVFAGLLVAGPLAIAAPGLAQTALVDTATISARCAVSVEACADLVRGAIATLQAADLTPEEVNAQLGLVAGAAVSGSAQLSPAQRVEIAGLMQSLAAASTNPEQRASLEQIASSLAAGRPVDLVAVASSLSET